MEYESGVSVTPASAGGAPWMLLKNCRLPSTSDSSAEGVPRSRAASRVSRSNASSGGVSARPVSARAARRAGSRSTSAAWVTG